MKKQLLTLLTGLLPLMMAGQFAPPAGEPGTTAIHKDSSIFVNWATGCHIIRGLKDIAQPDSGFANAGDSSMAIGIPDGGIVSLGDNGQAVITFSQPIQNKAGWDFAIFENSFSNTFLELAFVEVSSNGTDYSRFPASSLTQDTIQVNSFGSIDATKIHHLAGKYRGSYGTPFDLGDLDPDPDVNTDSITYVRIIDVVGSINDLYASYDQHGNKVNDPYPTLFPSSGFDLDAVGVINQAPVGIAQLDENRLHLQLYPNPFKETTYLKVKVSVSAEYLIAVTDLSGKQYLRLTEQIVQDSWHVITLDTGKLAVGPYLVTIQQKFGQSISQLIMRQ